jgi:hypothetical protein
VRQSTINDERMSVDEGRVIARKKQRRLRDVLRETGARNRLHMCEKPLHCLDSLVRRLRSKAGPFPKIGVAIPPGQMQFTRTLLSPSSFATDRVRWITAAFLVAVPFDEDRANGLTNREIV